MGNLFEISKAEFSKNNIYIVEDGQIIYIWVGTNVPKEKMKLAKKTVKDLKNKGNMNASITIMEYCIFLFIMDFS